MILSTEVIIFNASPVGINSDSVVDMSGSWRNTTERCSSIDFNIVLILRMFPFFMLVLNNKISSGNLNIPDAGLDIILANDASRLARMFEWLPPQNTNMIWYIILHRSHELTMVVFLWALLSYNVAIWSHSCVKGTIRSFINVMVFFGGMELRFLIKISYDLCVIFTTFVCPAQLIISTGMTEMNTFKISPVLRTSTISRL